MSLQRSALGWSLFGAAVGLGLALLVALLARSQDVAFGVVGIVLSTLVVASSGGAGAAIGFAMERAGSRGRGCLAPVFAVVAAGLLLSAVVPILTADLVSRGVGATLGEVRRRGEVVVRDRKSPGLGEAGESAVTVARSLASLLLAPLVCGASLIVAPVAALGATKRRRGGIRV